jgi:cell division protein FtsW (lipid II flippase)
MLYKATDRRQVIITSILAALHVLILVVSKDLGSGSIFFVTYLLMLYTATTSVAYLGLGIGAFAVAAPIAYKLFSHVRTRVQAWKDPLAVIDNQGYQICQSLFAIGTGGWFGMGLYQGMPSKIPVVLEDFVFSAICEEMGGVFAICLILVCASCYLMFLNIAMQIRNQFYKLIALGLGTVYGFQVFLTIGGAIKFIPSTGVTLPLVSYGGSSLLSTFMIFAIIQGLYIIREDEVIDEKKK